MMFRYFYLDEMGLLSLHAQLNHQELVEHTVSTEDGTSSKLGWSAALKAVLGASGETTEEVKEVVSHKFRLRTENMLNEIRASLRARGTLYQDFHKAAEVCRTTEEPVWVSGRYPFYAAQFTGTGGFESVNHDKAIVFSSRLQGDGYDASDNYFKHSDAPPLEIVMSASLHKFPGLRDGHMGVTCHEALFFRQLGGAAFKYLIFGSLFAVGDKYQVKPYALSV
ncbi:MAG: hypothetical protein KJ072_27920 [Verrucomicrobia bacterium]|nr:hypothetical protein [Verrucomicrobiota bacterium]